MKLLFFLTWREIRFRWRTLLPYVLIAAALIFTSTAQVTFQESANSHGEPIQYMTSLSYMILFSAFALIGFVAAKTYFTLYGENILSETGTLRAMGMKLRDIRRMRVILGFLCIGAAVIIAVPLALLYIYLFVKSCTSVDMTITTFVPLVYKIPVGNILIVIALIVITMMCGVLTGSVKEKSIVSLLRRGKIPMEAENGRGNLPDAGTLADYGKLFVRRSVKRCVKYNFIVAFLLILPMIFLLGASTFEIDRSTHTFTLFRQFDYEAHEFTVISDEMIDEICQIPGVSDAEKFKSSKIGYGDGFIGIRVYADNSTDQDILRGNILEYADREYLEFEDSAVLRDADNMIERNYIVFFLTNAVILFAVACITTFALLKARLAMRHRELSLLRAIGARVEDIKSAVIPETIADYAAGALFSIMLGAFGFLGLMADGGGSIDVFAIIVLCLLFLAGSIFVQIRASDRMTDKLLTDADNHL